MKKSKTILVGRDFGRFPAGRYLTDGKYSGEAFRDRILRELPNVDTLTIDLAGTDGYGSSFLEEVFGGLARNNAIPLEEIKNKIIITSSDPDIDFFVEEAVDYLDEALKKRRST